MGFPVEAVVDAMSVFTNITAADVEWPLEESLIAIVMAIREQFSVGHLKTLWWCHTDDMLADALTKGAVHREPLLKALSTGSRTLTGKVKRAAIPLVCTPKR